MAACLVRAHAIDHLIEEVLLENIRFQRGAGFAGHNDQRLLEVQAVANRLHLRRIGGVEDAERRKLRLLPEGLSHHFGAQTGAAHAEQQNRLEATRFDVRAQFGEVRQILSLPLDNVEPAQPFLLAVRGP